MIRQISASDKRFKTLTFRKGLNILAAVKDSSSSSKQTRNSAGKTSFIEAVHFLMGSSIRKGSLFKSDALSDWSFGLDFDLGTSRTQIVRSCAEPNWITIKQGTVNRWPVKPSNSRNSEEPRLRLADWRLVLGSMMFAIRDSPQETEELSGTGGPSFRQMFSYFARRQLAGGFENPLKHSSQQRIGSIQVSLTALLGLDWTIPGRLQELREQEANIRELKRAVNAKTLGDFVGNATKLRNQVALLQDRVTRLRSDVSEFRVVTEYNDLEREAAALTQRINSLADDNVLDEQARRSVEASIKEERGDELEAADLAALYSEAGVSLPGIALRRLEDVRAFHRSVVSNRKGYLQSELQAIGERLRSRTAEAAGVSERLSEIMRLLKSKGALEQFTELQAELTRRDSELQLLRQRLEAAERLEMTKAKMSIDRTSTYIRLQQDHREQAKRVNDAIVAFEKVSSALYESAGSFSIGSSESGPEFALNIQGARSKGIANMQMFCFDMMLISILSNEKKGPGFLIHDSHLFDGVDERQVGAALALGAKYADQYGFQYIVTMNEDAIPREYPAGFSPEEHLLPVKLTDASETGGLFGFRFE